MKISKLSSLALIAMMILGTVGVFTAKTNAAPTTLEVIAAGGLHPGTNSAHYTSSILNTGDNIVLNITVFDVSKLANWQLHLKWDSSVLTYVSISMPSDNVFAGAVAAGKSLITPPPVVDPDGVTWGATYINGPPTWCFNGTGVLCQVTLQVIASVDEINPLETSALTLFAIGADTFLIDCESHDIAFTPVDGDFRYEWEIPSYNPTIYIKPAVEKPDKLGDTFGLEIWVKDVHAGWSIIGFQFSLMWNTTFIEPVAPYYDNGTFLEGFDYYDGGVLYVADVNQHNRPLPLTPIDPMYNYSMFACIIMPDGSPNPPYHAPFPSGEGKIMTVYFKAVYETISPVEDWTWIDFITFAADEDTYALNKYMHLITMSTEACHYRAPMKILGLAIDLYTQYPAPYGGQGGNMTSDMFGPQALVDLFALVTYNEYPVQQKLVGFQVFHQGATRQYNIYREGTTDADGVAHVSFRLPWPCADPVGEIFGWWYVNATVEVAEQVVVDNLKFWVWWPVEVLSIEPKQTEFVQRKTGGDDLEFTETFGTYSMQILNVTITATIYDELSFFIGSATYNGTVGLGYYDEAFLEGFNMTTPPLVYSVDFAMPLPTNAVVGKGQAFGNAFSALPWLGGYPYCPEVTNTIDFYITKP